MLRGLGGELMRHALCHLIRKASEAELPLKNTPTVGELWRRNAVEHDRTEKNAAAEHVIMELIHRSVIGRKTRQNRKR